MAALGDKPAAKVTPADVEALLRTVAATGVSATSWFVGAFGCTLWILYYTGVHLWAALTATAFAGLANLAIALLATWRHSQNRQVVIAREVFAAST